MNDQNNGLQPIGRKAKEASQLLAVATTDQKNKALHNLAQALKRNQDKILRSNCLDVEEAKHSGMSMAMLDRLVLEGRLEGIIADLRQVEKLPDPVGEIFDEQVLPNGLKICKRRTPIGVLGIIYEARPNVTVDVASLAIKSGNAALLRGGSETMESNKALVSIIQGALAEAGLPPEGIQLIEDPDRARVLELLRLHDYVDMIIPRGGAGLHQFCRDNSTIPVITGGIGICHLFVDEKVDVEKALEVIHNAKTQRPTVCNALDTLLVHVKAAKIVIPKVIERLSKSHVAFRLDPAAFKFAEDSRGSIRLAEEGDWDTEWLNLTLGIKVVQDLKEAIGHIKQHSTGHSDGILTEIKAQGEQFIREVDSAAVYVNASTRFTDGSQFGLGAEVAISTQKLHARGPMGLKELTTYKWVIHGSYQVRS